MAEYIEREALIDYLTSPTGFRTNCKDCTDIYGCMDCIVEKAIRNRPAADVAPVRHGRCIEKQEKDTFAGYLYSYECSECGRVEKCKEPYCNCGARMDGGEPDA